MANFVNEINLSIQSFVETLENHQLINGTGNYSTPFRGTLFGQTDSDAIAKTLSEKPVDILLMGSNPNVPKSLEKILSQSVDDVEFKSFVRQRDSGKFSQQDETKDGLLIPGWNPIHNTKTRGWKAYSELLLSQVGDIDNVAMANFVHWGSSSFNEFIRKLSENNMPLLMRILEFSNALNIQIISTLKPKLVIAPFSLSRNSELKKIFPVNLTFDIKNLEHVNLQFKNRSFNFYIGNSAINSINTTVLQLPHPSALQWKNKDLEEIMDRVCNKVSDLI